MFSHVMIGTNDLEKAKAFYDALLGTLDVRPAKVDRHRIFYFTKTGTFSVSKPINGQPATPPMAGPSALWPIRRNKPMPGMRPASPMAPPPAKTRPAFAKVRRQALPRLSARSRRQQDLRDASDRDVNRRMGGAKRYPSAATSGLNDGFASLHPSYAATPARSTTS
jgi:catechol 2,3-dioxygenase-like lactoylglutathione lyase family enzyme